MTYDLSYGLLALIALAGLLALIAGAFIGPPPGPRPPTFDDPPPRVVPQRNVYDQDHETDG